jgi:hypothetical protein
VGQISLAASDLRHGHQGVGGIESIDDVPTVDDHPFPRLRGRPVEGE